jgi:hypothetical protein
MGNKERKGRSEEKGREVRRVGDKDIKYRTFKVSLLYFTTFPLYVILSNHESHGSLSFTSLLVLSNFVSSANLVSTLPNPHPGY